MKYHVINEVIPFSDEQFTERGERVYVTLKVTIKPAGLDPIEKIIRADPGLGFTEEFIEETILGCQKALEDDFPDDLYRVERLKPNVIVFEYDGMRGYVN